MRPVRAILIWTALAAVVCVPIAAAAASPLLAWRDPIYILAGFAGIIILGLVLVQALLIGGQGIRIWRISAILDLRRAG